MASELVAHGRADFLGHRVLLAGAKARVERGGEHFAIHGLLDGGHDRPAAFARIGNAAGEICERRVLRKGSRRQVEQPRADHAAAAPDLGDIREIEVVIEIVIHARRGFRVHLVRAGVDIGVGQDVETLAKGRHDPVLDPVVDHFDEVPGARGAAVDVAQLGRARELVAPRRWIDGSLPGSECAENWVHPLDRVLVAADHHAIPALEAPDAAAGADVEVMNPLGLERRGAPAVIAEIRIAAVDDRVAGLEQARQLIHDPVGDCRRNHDPRVAGLFEFGDKIRECGRPPGTLVLELADGVRVRVVNHTLVSVAENPANHVRAHSPESDHSELHSALRRVEGFALNLSARAARDKHISESPRACGRFVTQRCETRSNSASSARRTRRRSRKMSVAKMTIATRPANTQGIRIAGLGFVETRNGSDGTDWPPAAS